MSTIDQSDHSAALATLKREAGTRLFSATLAAPPDSRAAALRLVRGTKGRRRLTLDRAAGLALDIAGHHRAGILARLARRRRNRFGPLGAPLAGLAPDQSAVRVMDARNHRPLSDRLEDYKRRHLRAAVESMLPSLSGEVTGTIEFADTFAEVGMTAETSRGDQYSRRCTYRKTDGSYTVRAQAGWNLTVRARGLANPAGLLTLVALPVECDQPGEEIFRAKWAAPSRGFSVKVTEGFIVRRENGDLAHAATIGAARAILGRRESERRASRHLARLRDLLTRGEPGELAGIVVTVRDSTAAGNCLAGTRAWVDRHFPGRDHATIGELLSVADQRPMVIAACLRAIRRARPLPTT